jgi:hypothetical protein
MAGTNISFPRESFHHRHSAFRGNKTHIILASSERMSICQSETERKKEKEYLRAPAGVMSYKHPVLRHAPSCYNHSGDRSVNRRGDFEIIWMYFLYCILKIKPSLSREIRKSLFKFVRSLLSVVTHGHQRWLWISSGYRNMLRILGFHGPCRHVLSLLYTCVRACINSIVKLPSLLYCPK